MRAKIVLAITAFFLLLSCGKSAVYTTLYSFSATNGSALTNTYGTKPCDGLILNGSTLYGTTEYGELSGNGTVFALNPASSAPAAIPLNIKATQGAAILSWSNSAFALQSATNINGMYTNVPGATSPYTNAFTNTQQYFRLVY